MAELKGIYSTGTVSVAANGTTVTGNGTTWVAALIRAGDLFCKADFSAITMVTETPTNPTSLKIEAWPTTALAAGSNYKIIRLSDSGRLADVLMLFATGLASNVSALAAVVLAANKGIYATGAGALATYDLSALGRAIAGLSGGANGKIPVVTGASAAVLRDILGTVSMSDGVPNGAIFERGSNANGEYVRFADGTQVCAKSDMTFAHINDVLIGYGWTFPAAFSGTSPLGFFRISTGASPTKTSIVVLLALRCSAAPLRMELLP